MKGTDVFKETIKSYLDERAVSDKLFAISYHKEGKSIDDCITYILNQVKNSGCNGFADDEIYGMAVHYYDEDNIKVGNKINATVVVNHKVELTEEEKAEARKKAIEEYRNIEIKKMQERNKPKTKNVQAEPQPSLFDM